MRIKIISIEDVTVGEFAEYGVKVRYSEYGINKEEIFLNMNVDDDFFLNKDQLINYLLTL